MFLSLCPGNAQCYVGKGQAPGSGAQPSLPPQAQGLSDSPRLDTVGEGWPRTGSKGTSVLTAASITQQGWAGPTATCPRGGARTPGALERTGPGGMWATPARAVTALGGPSLWRADWVEASAKARRGLSGSHRPGPPCCGACAE